MDKRYQVFVSSTYEDLQDERKEVMQALLELDCIPCGMELFPASDEDQWSLIRRVIDDCDYYILIIGGRYGSMNAAGISYTEMEYRYALETHKPIISFLHKLPDSIPSGKAEKSEEGRNRLQAFKALAQLKMVKYWTSPADLGSVVSRSLNKLIKQYPAIGWVKATNVISEDVSKELLLIRKENDDLKRKIDLSFLSPPVGTEGLSQGDEIFNVTLRFLGKKGAYDSTNQTIKSGCTWNELFSSVSPILTNENTEKIIKETIIACAKKKSFEELIKIRKLNKYINLISFSLDEQEFQTIKIQFKALGLITKSEKSRSVKDTEGYWKLTPYGDHIMTQLVAIRKSGQQ